MHSLILIALVIALCLAFGALAAVVVAIFQLAVHGLEAIAIRRRRRRWARSSKRLSRRR